MSKEYVELKDELDLIKQQLNQMNELLQKLTNEKLNSQTNSSNKKFDNNKKNNKKYKIERVKKIKNKENCLDFSDIVTETTIISKYVVKDLKTKGWSKVKRYPNEEKTTIPINDPLHVSIFYNFGFVLDNHYNKHSAVILISTVINHNVIHMNVVKKLNLDICKSDLPFKVTASSGSFNSNLTTKVIAGVKENNRTNNMVISDFVISTNDHHKDMIILKIGTLLKKGISVSFSNETLYEFEKKDNTPYIL